MQMTPPLKLQINAGKKNQKETNLDKFKKNKKRFENVNKNKWNTESV